MTLLLKATPPGSVVPSTASLPLAAGDTLKLRGNPKALTTKPRPKGSGGRAHTPGTVTESKM